MNNQERKAEATALARNRLLPEILAKRRDTLYDTWRMADNTELREQTWHAMHQLDQLAGAIDDAVREYGGSRADE